MRALLAAILGIAATAAVSPVDMAPGARVVHSGLALLGVREATGHNDGPQVEAMLRAVGATKGDPWCAAFDYRCFSDAGFSARVPRSAWSPDWLMNPDSKFKTVPVRPGSVFGVYFPSKGRIAHTGITERDLGETVMTLEGNTNNGGSRDGDGVYRRRRLKSQLWFKDWLK